MLPSWVDLLQAAGEASLARGASKGDSMTWEGVDSTVRQAHGMAESETQEGDCPPPLSEGRLIVRAPLLDVGEVLGSAFEIRALLGEGGMGQVYEAHDRLLSRRVAIKVPWPDSALSVRREAQALAALRHPSMVTIYGLGLHRGIEYVVMERIYGTTLEAHLDRVPENAQLYLDEVVDVLIGIADGLGVVHRAGMAHRDVKPANVMLAPGNRTVLTDLGIFQAEAEQRTGKSILGSPAYMAPETITASVARGEGYLVDVYALGVIAFEMLTGSVPFIDERVLKVLWMHTAAPTPDPTDRRPDTPPRLARLVRSMLAKDPKARPQSMEEIAWQLRRLLQEPASPDDRMSVVIAEDDPCAATVLSLIVARAAPEAHVRVARNGREALVLVRRKVPNLLVVDLHLPGVSGLDVCMQLRGTRVADRCRIVCTSAQAERGELEALRNLGFTRFVPKGDEIASQLPAILTELKRLAARRSVRP
jgi:CheY-like chemotaxis protein